MDKIVESKDVKFRKVKMVPDMIVPLEEIEPGSSEFTAYQAVDFEPVAFRKDGKDIDYDHSLITLKKRGFERHPRTTEVFSIMFDVIERHALHKGYVPVYENMLDKENASARKEWLSLAISRLGDNLSLYVDPDGVCLPRQEAPFYAPFYIQSGGKYAFSYAERQDFFMPASVQGYRSFKEYKCNDLVFFIFGRNFNDLPETFQEIGGIWIPFDNEIYPLGHRIMSGEITHGLCASRGVREKG